MPRRRQSLARHATSQAGGDGLGEKNRQEKSSIKVQPTEDNIIVENYAEALGGALERIEDDLGEDTLQELRSRIAAIEADLQKLKTRDSVVQGTTFPNQLSTSPDISSRDTSLPQFATDETTQSSSQNATLQNIRIPQELFEEDRRKHIARLNKALWNFAAQPSNVANIKELWRWYSHCRNNLSSAWHLVPTVVWSLLWEAFSRPGANNPHRMEHIRKLAEDMKAAGLELNGPQTLLYLKSLFSEGKHKEAISQWESAQTALAYNNSTAIKYWTLGVRMLAMDSQAERAQGVTDLFLNGLDGARNPRVLIPIIRAWLESNDPVGVQRAWAIYIRLKNLLRSTMEMTDYDEVSGAFLAAQQTELALGVFRDMMLTGDSSTSGYESVALYKRTIKIAVDFRSFKLAPAETSWTSYAPFTSLPGRRENKFFYGSWIKKLIGEGQPDWAAQVASLMYQRNIIPDPRHMNGIIGAWLRSGTDQNQRKAEDLAWKMVDARLDFVDARHRFGLERPLRAVAMPEKKGFGRPSTYLQISTRATLETFCILISYYQRRRRGDRIHEICTKIRAAKIKPNASFLNDLLLVGAMQNRKQWTWNTYSELVNTEGVLPNYDTFTILWGMMKDNLQNKAKLEFPSPRILFQEMVKWAPLMGKDAFSREGYELILNCFSRTDDQIGTLVAIRGMQREFGIYPNEDTVKNVVVDLARTGHRKVIRQLTLRHERTRDMQSRVFKVTEALKNCKDQRAKFLLEKGITFDGMDEDTRSDEVIMLLSDILRFAVKSRVIHPDRELSKEPSGDNTEQSIQHAAEQMGLSQYGLDAPDIGLA